MVAMRRAIVAMLMLGALVGCGNDGASEPPTGESLYKKNCAACHGGSAQGASGPALVGDDATAYTDEQLAMIIADGIGDMDGFSGRLDAEEIDMVIDHLRTLDSES
jgi:mono/diheme cytochrome c family protein